VPRADCTHTPSNNPRRAHLCCKCGATIAEPIPEIAVQNGQTRPRNVKLEKYLLELASQAEGYQTDFGLWNKANKRARPGDVQVKDFDKKIEDKLADVINYYVWSAERHYDGYLTGDPYDTDKFERYMRCIPKAVRTWLEHHRDCA